MGVEGYLVWWTQSLLTDRIVMLGVGEHMREVHLAPSSIHPPLVSAPVAQGGVKRGGH